MITVITTNDPELAKYCERVQVECNRALVERETTGKYVPPSAATAQAFFELSQAAYVKLDLNAEDNAHIQVLTMNVLSKFLESGGRVVFIDPA